MIEKDNYSLIFVIACKYYRSYPTFIKYYVDNIQKFYSNTFTIIVDNNSIDIQDIKDQLKDYKDVIILDNNTICKYEIGAYKVAINYMIDNDLIDKYNYCIFTQDTFILKNKYDFNNLKNNNIFACPLFYNKNDQLNYDSVKKILADINLLQYFDKSFICPMNSFVLHSSKLKEFLDYTKNIISKIKYDSHSSERYLGVILYKLNNFVVFGIDGFSAVNYDFYSVNVYDDSKYYFVKRVFSKDEHTI